MEGNSEDVGVAMDNQKTIKRCKLESVPVPDPVTSEPVEDFQKQSTTHGQTKTSNSGFDCETQSCDGGEVSSEEFAFSIDHVLEQILGSLDRTLLFKCRLVSRKWRLASTHIILKRVYTLIAFKYSPTDQVYHLKERYKTDGDIPKSTLEDLTRFLTESYSPSGPFKISEFPCNNFKFLEGSLVDPQLHKFLTTFGEYIRVLSLDFWDALQGECEGTLIKHIGHLLNTQAPRLRCLHFIPSSELESTETDDSDDAALGSNPNILSPPFKSEQESMEAQRKGKNGLRELHCDVYGIPRKILDNVISISPDLQEISLYWEDYHLLCSPLNRLHFLKEFNFDCNDADFDCLKHFKLLEAALCVSKEERESLSLPPIKFRGLAMSFDNDNILTPLFSNRAIYFHFVNVINKILELSWDTLESIELTNLDQDTFYGNVKITFPPVLAKVRYLDLCSYMVWNFGLEIFSSYGNFKTKETFPKLKIIQFDKVIDYNEIESAGEYLQNCNFGPASSVEYVEVTLQLDDVPQGEDEVEGVAEDVERLRLDVTNSLVRLFPSAELLIEDELY